MELCIGYIGMITRREHQWQARMWPERKIYGMYSSKYVLLDTEKAAATAVSSAQDAVITPVLQDNEYRIVLTWGQSPRDLDSHITGPVNGGKRCAVDSLGKVFIQHFE